MTRVSHIGKLMQRNARSIHFVTAKDSIGRDCYFFIMPQKSKEAQIEQLINDSSIDLSEIGDIVAAGFGTQPSEAVTQMLQKHFKVDPASIMRYAECA